MTVKELIELPQDFPAQEAEVGFIEPVYDGYCRISESFGFLRNANDKDIVLAFSSSNSGTAMDGWDELEYD